MSAGEEARKKILRRQKLSKAMEAAFDDELDVLRPILEDESVGMPLDAEEKEDSFLGEAACGNAVSCVEYLLEKGANPNHKGQQSRTPIMRASYNNAVEVFPLLLNGGADPRLLFPQERDEETGEILFRPWDPQDVNSLHCCDEIKDMLKKWPIERTLCLLRDASEKNQANNEVQQQEMQNKKQQLEAAANSLDTQLYDLKKQYTEALARREERLLVYDTAKCEGDHRKLDNVEVLIKESMAEVDQLKLKCDELEMRKKKAFAEVRSHTVQMEGGMTFDLEIPLAQIEDAALHDVGGDIKNAGKTTALIVDPSGNGTTFLTYRNCLLVDIGNSHHMCREQMTLNVLSCLRHGKPFVVDLRDKELKDALSRFRERCNETSLSDLYENILNHKIRDPKVYEKLISEAVEKDHPDLNRKAFSPVFTEKFTCTFITKLPFPEKKDQAQFFTIKLKE